MLLRHTSDIRKIGRPTPEWLAACDDVAADLQSCRGVRLEDECQLQLFTHLEAA